MSEYICISKKQYCILLSFALMLIFTTASLQVFVAACAQVLLFCLINLIVFRTLSKKRICWGIFLILAALMGEAMLALADVYPSFTANHGFYLLPASTFLFLSAPMFGYFDECHTISVTECAKGLLYYVICGSVISVIREAFGAGTIWNRTVPYLSHFKLTFLRHSAGAAFIVMLSLILLPLFFRGTKGKKYWLQTEEGRSKKYSAICLQEEKDFVKLSLCLLIYDLIFAAISVVLIKFGPDFIQKSAHIVLISSLMSVSMFTLIVWIFKQRENLDRYRFLPFLGVITTTLPMMLYVNYYRAGEGDFSGAQILWWIAFLIGVWLTSVVIISYTRVVQDRLIFGKQPRLLEGMPFVLLQVFLAMLVLMPWSSIMPVL